MSSTDERMDYPAKRRSAEDGNGDWCPSNSRGVGPEFELSYSTAPESSDVTARRGRRAFTRMNRWVSPCIVRGPLTTVGALRPEVFLDGSRRKWMVALDDSRDRDLDPHRILAGARCESKGPQLSRLLHLQLVLLPGGADRRLRGLRQDGSGNRVTIGRAGGRLAERISSGLWTCSGPRLRERESSTPRRPPPRPRGSRWHASCCLRGWS
jgi:hypothetical protein